MSKNPKAEEATVEEKEVLTEALVMTGGEGIPQLFTQAQVTEIQTTMVTSQEYAHERNDLTAKALRRHIRKGHVEGATKIGNRWYLSFDATINVPAAPESEAPPAPDEGDES